MLKYQKMLFLSPEITGNLSVGDLHPIYGAIYVPAVNFSAPWWANFAAISVAIAAGIIFGVSPANRAAQMDPVLALSRR